MNTFIVCSFNAVNGAYFFEKDEKKQWLNQWIFRLLRNIILFSNKTILIEESHIKTWWGSNQQSLIHFSVKRSYFWNSFGYNSINIFLSKGVRWEGVYTITIIALNPRTLLLLLDSEKFIVHAAFGLVYYEFFLIQ